MRRFIITLSVLLASAAFASAQDNKVPDLPPQPTTIKHQTNYKYYGTTDKGFMGGIDLGVGVGFTSYNDVCAPIDLTAVLGYRFNQYIKLGFGFGARYYAAADKVRADKGSTPIKNFSFPLFLSLRGNFLNSDSREMVPYWRVDAGYAIQDGIFFRPAIGLSFGSEARNKFNLSLSYNPQEALIDKKAGSFEAGVLHIVALNFGYEF